MSWEERKRPYLRCANFPNLIVVLLMSLPIADAIFVNSDLLPPPLLCCSSRCFCSATLRAGTEDRLRIDSTQALNSLVRSWTGIA